MLIKDNKDSIIDFNEELISFNEKPDGNSWSVYAQRNSRENEKKRRKQLSVYSRQKYLSTR